MKRREEKRRSKSFRKKDKSEAGSSHAKNDSDDDDRHSSGSEKMDNDDEAGDSVVNKTSSISMDRRIANESKRKDTGVSKALANLKADREKKKQQGWNFFKSCI